MLLRCRDVSTVSKILGPSVTAISCSPTEKQEESIAFKDVVFEKGKSKNCTINVIASKKEQHIAVLLL